MARRRASAPPPSQGLTCYVFTEGAVTEPEYLDAVKAFGDRLAIKVDNRHGRPDVIVPLAIKLVRQLKAERLTGAPPEVWCVFDHDGDNRGDIDGLIAEAERAGVRVAFSHPCFELWLLLHYRSFGAPSLGNCAQVSQELRRLLPQYRKGVRVSDIRGRFELARKRAEQLRKQHERDGRELPSRQDPSTSVYELIDRLGILY